MENFKLYFVDALKDEQVAEILSKINRQSNSELHEAVVELQRTVVNLKNQISARDQEIEGLKHDNDNLRVQIDDLEQYSRRSSIRVFGVPEDANDDTDSKIVSLCNDHLKLSPPLQLSDIEVSHRAGKSTDQQRAAFERRKQERIAGGDADAANLQFRSRTAPRAILVRFVSRRTKGRVMASKSRLKGLNRTQPTTGASPQPNGSPDDRQMPPDADLHPASTTNPPLFPNPIYITDDLTQRRAKLAFDARQLKASRKLADTWVYDCRVMVKDMHGRVSTITRQSDLEKYK